MNVLSLFDGMSCGQIALKKLGIKVDNYFACEIDKYAIKVTMDNFPDTKQLGDVTKVDFKSLPKIDLLIGGSPCQGFSFAGKQLNFNDPRSALFFEYVRALREAQPEYFLLENVRMKKEYQDVINQHLGVEPILINSALVSAQNRNRLYWTNISNVRQPEDKKIYLKDIILTNQKDNNFIDSKHYLSEKIINGFKNGSPSFMGRFKPCDIDKKSYCLTARYYKMGKTDPYIVDNFGVRKLTVLECKRLQTVPDDYLMNVSNTQAYKMLGNGWTVDVITHILKGEIKWQS